MMDMELLEAQLAELPLYGYFSIDPKDLEFSERIRWICPWSAYYVFRIFTNLGKLVAKSGKS